jgi:hypothetical protein
MDDRDVVAMTAADAPAGIAMAYDKYAAALYGYCRSMLRQPTDAAEALVDTFVIAAMTMRDRPKDPELRPWLYSIARGECLRRVQARLAAGDTASEQAAAGAWPADATMPLRVVSLPVDPFSSPIDATMVFRALDQPAGAPDGLTHGHRDHGPAEPPADPLPAELRERVLRLCGPASAEVIAYQRTQARRAGPAIGRTRRPSIRGNPGAIIAIVAVLAWVAAAVSVAVLTLAGSHSAPTLPARPTASSPAAKATGRAALSSSSAAATRPRASVSP